MSCVNKEDRAKSVCSRYNCSDPDRQTMDTCNKIADCCTWQPSTAGAGATLEEATGTNREAAAVGNTDYVARTCSEYKNLLKRSGICPAGEENCCPKSADKMSIMKPQDLRFYPLVAPYKDEIDTPKMTTDFRSRDSIIFPEVCEGTDECDKDHFAEICCKESSKADFLKNSIFPTYFHFYTMLVFLILGISIGGLDFFTPPAGKEMSPHVGLAKFGVMSLCAMFGVAVGWHLISASRYSFHEITSENETEKAFSVGSGCNGIGPTYVDSSNPNKGVRCGSSSDDDDNCLLVPKDWRLPESPSPGNYECKGTIPISKWFAYSWNTTLSGKILAIILLILTLVMFGVAGRRLYHSNLIRSFLKPPKGT